MILAKHRLFEMILARIWVEWTSQKSKTPLMYQTIVYTLIFLICGVLGFFKTRRWPKITSLTCDFYDMKFVSLDFPSKVHTDNSGFISYELHISEAILGQKPFLANLISHVLIKRGMSLCSVSITSWWCMEGGNMEWYQVCISHNQFWQYNNHHHSYTSCRSVMLFIIQWPYV